MEEVDNLRHFTVKGVEELVTLVEDLDSIRGREVAENYEAVLTWNKEEGVAQVLVVPSTNLLQGKGWDGAELLRIVNLTLGSLSENSLRGLRNCLGTVSKTSSTSRRGRSCSFAK